MVLFMKNWATSNDENIRAVPVGTILFCLKYGTVRYGTVRYGTVLQNSSVSDRDRWIRF